MEIEATPWDKLNKDNFIVFMHVLKTGGTTLYEHMRNIYGKDHFFVANPSEIVPRLLARGTTPVKALAGHIMFDTSHQSVLTRVNKLKGPLTTLLLLRNPVDRVVSHYYFLKYRDTKHGLHTAANNFSIQELYKRKIEFPYLHNWITRHLSGNIAVPYFLPNTGWDTVNKAYENLCKMSMFGYCEKLNEFINICTKNFKWPELVWRNWKVNTEKPRKIDDLTYRVIKEHNHLDFKLYEMSINLYKDRKSKWLDVQ